MALIKGNPLRLVQKLFGLGSNQLAGRTNLDDGDVTQVLSINDITRRAEVAWFQGVLENVHSGADDERSTLDPYNPGANAVAPYPAFVDETLDVWLLGVSLLQNSGTAALTGAQLTMNVPTFSLGWGVDDAGDPVTASPGFPLAIFDSQDSSVAAPAGNNLVCLTAGGELPFLPVRVRLPRGGAFLVFDSTSSGAAEFRMLMLLGLFPVALGQDVVT